MDLNLIKNRISCRDYLQTQGILVPKTGRIKSPLRPDAQNPTSFLVSSDHWYDFGSGNGGDVIDLCAQLEFDGNIGKAIPALTQRLGLQITHPSSSAWRNAIQKLCNRTEYYHSKLTDDDRKYLHSRGFTDATIDDVKIGRVTDGNLKGRLFLPYFKNGYVCYYATRARPGSAQPESKYMKASLKESPFYEHIPWGLPTLQRTTHPGLLVISEGYFDALSWYQEGYCVLSAITGRFSHDQLSTVLAACNSFDRVLIIYDNDPVSHAGAGFTQSMAEWLFANHIEFTVARTPDGIKDVNDFYAPADGIPEHHADLTPLVSSAQDGLEYLASTFTDVKSAEKFIEKLKRYHSRAELVDIVTKTKFPNDVKKELFEVVKSTPKEAYISELIRKEHQIIYLPEVGFYEWNGRVWEKTIDEDIKKYANSAYGDAFRSAQRARQMLEMLKIDCLCKEELNKRPIITFQNGTLEINTGVFRDPSPDDYASIIMDYAYDKTARADLWEKFIEDVCNDVPERQDLLQRMVGYVLLPNCEFQKIFFLYGESGNGKSVFMDLIAALFGEENISSVEPGNIAEDFQRIQIQNSLLNIGTDVASDISKGSVREWLLKISCGEPVTACYKGKDYIKFRPRCKLVFSCNSLPKASDTKGLERRFKYVHFERSYVETPDPSKPLQRKEDKELKPRLLAELPGIFNWAYSGYRTLLQSRTFPDTPEQAEFSRIFKENSNPIVVFIDESNLSGEYSRDELWNRYLLWCDQTNHRPYTRNNFFSSIREALGDRIIDESYRRLDDGSRKRYIVIAGSPLVQDGSDEPEPIWLR